MSQRMICRTTVSVAGPSGFVFFDHQLADVKSWFLELKTCRMFHPPEPLLVLLLEMNRDMPRPVRNPDGIFRDGELPRALNSRSNENDRCFAFDPAAGNGKGGQEYEITKRAMTLIILKV